MKNRIEPTAPMTADDSPTGLALEVTRRAVHDYWDTLEYSKSAYARYEKTACALEGGDYQEGKAWEKWIDVARHAHYKAGAHLEAVIQLWRPDLPWFSRLLTEPKPGPQRGLILDGKLYAMVLDDNHDDDDTGSGSHLVVLDLTAVVDLATQGGAK